MGRKVVALIPAREGSQRVKDKNFKPFAGEKSLLHLKIKQLKACGCFDHIYVSSDSQRAKDIALEMGAEFLLRDSEMCKSSAKLYQYNTHMLETVPGDPYVAWTMVTAPLYEDYAPAIEKFLSLDKEKYDSLITVLPFREFLINEKGRPLNCTFGHWHLLTQELDKNFTITGSLYIAGKSEQIDWRYWIGLKPYLYEISKFECVDVDHEEDFRIAEMLHAWRQQQVTKVEA
ncbi:MAG: acylneuraminate cytidylyltransferase family protein [Candidatus Omnitrophica bacterium]|nr:acylneuraminate cytidylyltransferase family protein [Candidatus Omnitrophota bacterium]MCB9748197.1 acylneuraminate cytidylyltransferase family protein [Candidatus Omnitrophota bacterium]